VRLERDRVEVKPHIPDRKARDFLLAPPGEQERGDQGVRLEAIGLALDGMFGGELGKKAVRAYSEKVGKAKDAGMLRFGAPGIITGGTEGRPSPKHQFHHGDHREQGR
jgi:hypothetical protein